jgi:hypothetical protein
MGDFANSDAPLLLKRAKHGKAPGILAVARRLLTWTPSDPGSHAAVVELAVATITSKFLSSKITPLLPIKLQWHTCCQMDTCCSLHHVTNDML